MWPYIIFKLLVFACDPPLPFTITQACVCVVKSMFFVNLPKIFLLIIRCVEFSTYLHYSLYRPLFLIFPLETPSPLILSFHIPSLQFVLLYLLTVEMVLNHFYQLIKKRCFRTSWIFMKLFIFRYFISINFIGYIIKHKTLAIFFGHRWTLIHIFHY